MIITVKNCADAPYRLPKLRPPKSFLSAEWQDDGHVIRCHAVTHDGYVYQMQYASRGWLENMRVYWELFQRNAEAVLAARRT